MAPINREAIVVVLDVGASTSSLDTDGVSYLEKAKQCLSWIITRKILSGSKDEIGIIFFGSEETKNALAEDDFGDRYENINVLTEQLSMATWDMLREVNKVYGTCVDNSDWLDALVVAIDFLKHSMEGKVFSESKIVVLSKFMSEVKSEEQIKVIVNTIKNMDTNLVVIGPDVAGEDSQSETGHLIAQIVTDTKGVICSYDDALTQLRFHNKDPKKPQVWNVLLTIGSKIKIPVNGYKKIDGALNLGWKKYSVDGKLVMTDQAYFKQDEVVDPKDIVAGFTYGSTIVPFSEVEKQTMSYQSGEKCLSVLGFTPLSQVPKHLFVGDTIYYFVHRKNDEDAAVGFTALVKALDESEMAIIARRVYRAGCAPMLGAMIPKFEGNHCMLLFLELPYANDFKYIELPQLSKVKPTQKQMDCVDKLITAMDLTNPECFEDDEEPYIPEKLIDPFQQHVDHCIVLKALDKNRPIPNEPEKIIQDLLKPIPIIAERSKDILEEIQRLFPLKVQDFKKKKKEAAAVFDLNRKVANITDTNVKAEVDKDASMADLVKTKVFRVSTVDPESEFLSVLKSGMPFTKACEQMQTVITKLFIVRSDDGSKKPISALACLRKKCIEEDPEIYNSWLEELKSIVLERGDDTYWHSIVQENLGLINKLESEKSKISIEEAKLFNEIKKQEPESEFDDAMDAEDLLDMM